jgi:hypothetical protein
MTHQEIKAEITEWEHLKAKAEDALLKDSRMAPAYQEAIRQAEMHLVSLNKMLDLA